MCDLQTFGNLSDCAAYFTRQQGVTQLGQSPPQRVLVYYPPVAQMAQNQDGDQLNYFADQLLQCMEIDADESMFGCPGCCPGRTAKFIRPQFYPQSLTDVGVSEADLYALLDQLDQVFRDTGSPSMPNGLIAGATMVCIPLWFWQMNHYFNKRKDGLDKVVKEWNDKHKDQGIYAEWNATYWRTMKRVQERFQADLGLPGLDFKVNRQARDAYLNNDKK